MTTSKSHCPQVTIYWFSLTCNPPLISKLHSILSDDEKERAEKFVFQRHKESFIVGRATLREIISMRSGCAPHCLKFTSDSHGKPFIQSPTHLQGLQFSYSRSGDLAGVAICESGNSGPLGFDMEKIEEKNGSIDFDSLVNTFFSTSEIDWYYAQSKKNRLGSFYNLWTCKEAYLKALGVGLAVNLKSFAISFEESQPYVSFTHLEKKQSVITLNQMKLDDTHAACLATSSQKTPIIKLVSI